MSGRGKVGPRPEIVIPGCATALHAVLAALELTAAVIICMGTTEGRTIKQLMLGRKGFSVATDVCVCAPVNNLSRMLL